MEHSSMQTVKAEWVDDHERKEVEDCFQTNASIKSHNISFWCFDGASEQNPNEPIPVESTTYNSCTRNPEKPLLLQAALL